MTYQQKKPLLVSFILCLGIGLVALDSHARGGGRAGGAGFSRGGVAAGGSFSARSSAAQRGATARTSHRQSGYTDRTGMRQEGISDRTSDRQSNMTERSDGRQETYSNRQDERTTRQDNRQGSYDEARDDRLNYREDSREDWQDYNDDRWRVNWGYGAAAVAGAFAVGTIITAATYSSLDCVTTTVVVAGTSYRRCGDTWYRPTYSGDDVTYIVVNPPADY